MHLIKPINAKEFSALLTLIADFAYIAFGMIVEPTGEIHGSILTLSAELLAFAGTCLGLDYFAHRSNNKTKENGNKEGDAK